MRRKIYSEDDLIEQLEHFIPDTLANLTLVNLGARKAYYLQDKDDLNNDMEYFLENTSNPEEYKSYLDIFKGIKDLPEKYNGDSWKFIEEFWKLFKKEEDILHKQRVYSLMNKYYPKLHIHEFPEKSGAFIITKKPLSKYQLSILQGENTNKKARFLGKVIDYPCYKTYGDLNYNHIYNIKVSTNLGYEFQIFGNTFCSDIHKRKFESLAMKYEKALKSKYSIMNRIVKNVYLEEDISDWSKFPKDFEIV